MEQLPLEQVPSMDTPPIDPLHVAANAVSVSAIAFSWVAYWIGLAPVIMTTLASTVALGYYALVIYNDPMVKRWRHERRLRKIAHLKARIIGLEANQVFDEAIKLRLPTETLPSPTIKSIPRE